MLINELENYEEYPDHLAKIKEIDALTDIQNTWMQKILDMIVDLDSNIFVLTSDENGIKRREGILAITPLDTDTLEERRYRVWLKWYDTWPYTEYDLRDRLSRLCRDGNYELSIDVTGLTVTVKLGLTNKKNYAEMCKLIEELVPLQVVLNPSIIYNKYSQYTSKTHSQLHAYTHLQLREEVIS